MTSATRIAPITAQAISHSQRRPMEAITRRDRARFGPGILVRCARLDDRGLLRLWRGEIADADPV